MINITNSSDAARIMLVLETTPSTGYFSLELIY